MNRCLDCGASGPVELHHVTGRGDDGKYLDPEWAWPLCTSCHNNMHWALRRRQLDRPTGEADYRLRRVLLHLQLLR
jgi:hypothetical protein